MRERSAAGAMAPPDFLSFPPVKDLLVDAKPEVPPVVADLARGCDKRCPQEPDGAIHERFARAQPQQWSLKWSSSSSGSSLSC